MNFCRNILTFLRQCVALGGVCPSFPRKIAHPVLFAVIAIFFAGCAIKRSAYDVPEFPLPAQYKNSPASDIPVVDPQASEAAKNSESTDLSQDVGMIDWWRSFGNAELAALIDRGIANNPDVRIATLKMAQVKARADQARADQFPSVSASLGETIQAPGGQVASVPVGTESQRTTQKLYQASLRGNWRLDLWGEQSALAESAGLQLWQAAFERDNVQRGMVANLASSYVEYLSLNDRLRIAKEADQVLSGVLATIEKRVEAGDASVIELEQQKATIFAVRATIPNFEQQREDAITSIAFLVGTVPGALSLSGDGLDTLLLPTLVPALPSSLILRRPDVRSIEAKLLAADADVDVARARILPPLDLSAQIGYSSLAMSGLFQPLSLFWNVVTNLTVSIFDNGKLSSQRDQATLVHEEMVETYARTIYQAVREVESALATIRLTAKRFDAQQEATAAAQRAWDSSSEAYGVGGLDHLTLLDAGRTYLRYLDDYQRIKMERHRGYISLFQALGGGADFGQAIPGKGVRPSPVRGRFANAVTVPAPRKAASLEGVDWAAGPNFEDGMPWQVERFWQVELPGLYHRVAIGPTWRDLRSRYPQLMEGRIVRPRLSGRIEDSVDGQSAWYRLYVAKFSTPTDAQALCAALKANYQRCRVVSSTSDETVTDSVAGTVTNAPTSTVASASASTVPSTAVVQSDEQPLDGMKFEVEASPVPLAIAPTVQPEKSRDTSSKKLPRPDEKKSQMALPASAIKQESVREKLAYTIQLGAFSNLENAVVSYEFWRFRAYDAYVSEFKDTDGRSWYAVRTGIFQQRRDASVAVASIRRKEGAPAVMLPIMVDAAGKPAALALSDLKLPGGRPITPVVPEPPEAPEAPISVVEKNEQAPAAQESSKEQFAYSVQLGAFSSPENAGLSFSFWKDRGYEVFVSEIKDAGGRTWYAVRTGVHPLRNDAFAAALFFGRGEDVPAVVVKTPVDKSGMPKTLDIDKFLPTERRPASRDAGTMPAVAQSADAATVKKSFIVPEGVFKSGKAYTVQLAAFANLGNAARSLNEWLSKGYEAYVCETQDAGSGTRYAVRTGVFAQRRQAAALVRSLARKDGVKSVVVPAVLDQSGRLTVVDVATF